MTFRTIIRLIATSAFVFIASTATSSSLTERVNETIRLGKAFGLTLDINFAYEQANVLNETFFSKFRQFKDLNIENITSFVFENPDQFWVINQYFRQLYSQNYIEADKLSTYREASVSGLNEYLSIRLPPPESIQPTLISKTPELDRAVAIAQKLASGQQLEDIAARQVETAAKERLESVIKESATDIARSSRVKINSVTGFEPRFEIGLVNSLVESDSTNLFAQTSVAKNENFSILSAGVGYRAINPQEDLMLGINGFIDYELEDDHQRASIGIEASSKNLQINANRYFPLSGYRSTELLESTTSVITAKPADGYDIRFSTPLPFFPELALTGRKEKWWADNGLSTHSTGLGLKTEIVPSLFLELEHISNETLSKNMGTLTYYFQNHEADELSTQSPLINQRYQFVERTEDFVVALKHQTETVSETAEAVGYKFQMRIWGDSHVGDPLFSISTTQGDGVVAGEYETQLENGVWYDIPHWDNNGVPYQWNDSLDGLGIRPSLTFYNLINGTTDMRYCNNPNTLDRPIYWDESFPSRLIQPDGSVTIHLEDFVINATGLLDGYAGPTGMNTICTTGVNDGYLELRLVDENTEGASFDTQVGVVTL